MEDWGTVWELHTAVRSLNLGFGILAVGLWGLEFEDLWLLS